MSSSGSGGSESGEMEDFPPDKEYYASNRAFLCICICIGCSYQCLTEFPYLVLNHGGACFLLPYTAVLILLGIPMAALEMMIGQFRGRGILELWSCVPIGKGVGMAMLLKTFVLTAYKAFKDGCIFYYFLQVFQQELPWTRCYTWWGASPLNCAERDVATSRKCYAERAMLYNKSQNEQYAPTSNDTWLSVCGRVFHVPTAVYLSDITDQCREMRRHSEYAFYIHGVLKLTRGIEEVGGIRWELLVCYIFTWFVIFVCSAQGVATVGKISPLLALAPLVLIVAVTARVLFLPHASSAIVELIHPRWTALFDVNAWGDATLSVLTGLTVGVGQLQTLASYNAFDTYTLQWAFLTLPLFMTVTNLLCCALVFSMGGYLARTMGACVQDFDQQHLQRVHGGRVRRGFVSAGARPQQHQQGGLLRVHRHVRVRLPHHHPGRHVHRQAVGGANHQGRHRSVHPAGRGRAHHLRLRHTTILVRCGVHAFPTSQHLLPNLLDHSVPTRVAVRLRAQNDDDQGSRFPERYHTESIPGTSMDHWLRRTAADTDRRFFIHHAEHSVPAAGVTARVPVGAEHGKQGERLLRGPRRPGYAGGRGHQRGGDSGHPVRRHRGSGHLH